MKKYQVKFVYELYIEAESEEEVENIIYDTDYNVGVNALNCYIESIEEEEEW